MGSIFQRPRYLTAWCILGARTAPCTRWDNDHGRGQGAGAATDAGARRHSVVNRIRERVGTKTVQFNPTWRMKLILRRELPEPLWRRLRKLIVRVAKPAGGLCAGDRRKMIGLCSPRYSTSCERVSRGATCQSNLVRGTRSTRDFDAGVLRGRSPGCLRLSQREPQVNCGKSIARTSNCIRTMRTRVAAKLPKRSVALKAE